MRRSATDIENIPIPPLGIIKLVTGTPDVEWFIETGKISAERIRSALKQVHVDPEGLDCILDFGCGCGRVLSHLADLKAELHGCELVPSAKLAINELAPPLPYESEKFDLVYAFSTFTHGRSSCRSNGSPN
jgi:SAM-dependent methyltransferase